MNPVQLKHAFALDSIFDALGIDAAGVRRTMVCHGLGASMVIDLADPTGATEGVLHRVLERLVGGIVVVDGNFGKAGGPWFCAYIISAESPRRNLTALAYPTRLDAIVAALLEVAK